MAARVYRNAEEVEGIALEELEQLARDNLSWDNRYVDSMTVGHTRSRYSGHANFRTSGYPRSFDGRSFDDRPSYLRYRLLKKINRSGQIANAEWMHDNRARLEREKALAQRKKMIEEMTKPRIGVSVTIEENKKTDPGGYDRSMQFSMVRKDTNLDIGRVDHHRSSSGPCPQRVQYAIEDFQRALQLLDDMPDMSSMQVNGTSRVKRKVDISVSMKGRQGMDAELTRKDDTVHISVAGYAMQFAFEDLKHCIELATSTDDVMKKIQDALKERATSMLAEQEKETANG